MQTLVGVGESEHRYQDRPISDRHIAIANTVTSYICTLIMALGLEQRKRLVSDMFLCAIKKETNKTPWFIVFCVTATKLSFFFL